MDREPTPGPKTGQVPADDQSAEEIVSPNAVKPKMIDPLDQMVSGPALLEMLWHSDSRPSYRWLKYKTASKAIPSVRLDGRTWFVPRAVRDALVSHGKRRGRPNGGISKIARQE